MYLLTPGGIFFIHTLFSVFEELHDNISKSSIRISSVFKFLTYRYTKRHYIPISLRIPHALVFFEGRANVRPLQKICTSLLQILQYIQNHHMIIR